MSCACLPSPTPVMILTGPTGTGKTALSLDLAEELGAEIISADSMLVYRECDVVTAKPSPRELARVPHHLINVLSPNEQMSAARWADAAREAVGQIRARGRSVLVVGGTGFYLQVMLQPDRLAGVPPDPELRARLAAQPLVLLWEGLVKVDPAAAERVDRHNRPRVMRALEVAQGSATEPSPQACEFPWKAVILSCPRPALYERLDQRVDEMLSAGAVDETRMLLEKYGPDAPALQGVGYRHLVPVLQNSSKLEDAVREWKQATRRYAKRQETWFRHQLAAPWVEATNDSETLARLKNLFSL